MARDVVQDIEKVPLFVKPSMDDYRGNLVGRGGFGSVYKVGDIVEKLIPVGRILVKRATRTYLNIPLSGPDTVIYTDSLDTVIQEINPEAFKNSLREDEVHKDISGQPHIPRRLGYHFMAIAPLGVEGVSNLYAVHSQEYILGNNFQDLIRTKMPFHVIMKILSGIGLAIENIHLKGFTHGDIKPGNAIISGEGRNIKSYVIDFGTSRTQYTVVDKFIFTPEYASPEHAHGWLVPQIDDMAFGLSLHEALTGTNFFSGRYRNPDGSFIDNAVLNHMLWLRDSYSESDAANIVGDTREKSLLVYQQVLPSRFLEALEISLHPEYQKREGTPLQQEIAKLAKKTKPRRKRTFGLF
ncbi:MAG: hypothetical protein Q8Q01_01870 [archaeon]|nr:hypothetical protein [archaeon]